MDQLSDLVSLLTEGRTGIAAVVVTALMGIQLLFMLFAYRTFKRTDPKAAPVPRKDSVQPSRVSDVNALQRQDAATLRREMEQTLESVQSAKSRLQVVSSSKILHSEEEWEQLGSALPPRFQMSKVVLKFSSDTDGFSLGHLTSCLKGVTPSLLLFEDKQSVRFGAFCMGDWSQASELKSTGTGENFVFKILEGNKVEVYPWSRMNKTYQTRNRHYLAVGAGREGNAIRLDSDLLHGTSRFCETFASPTLSSSPDFECVRLEAWKV